MTAPRLGYGELTEGQDVPETTVNEMARFLEQGAGHFIFTDRDLATPPGSPAQGICYLVAASPTGAWSGKAGKIAFYMGSAWEFVTPTEGFSAWVKDEDALLAYDGTNWVAAGVTFATTGEVNTGTNTTKVINPDVLAGSNFGRRVAQILCTDPNGSAIALGDGQGYFVVPPEMNGMNLVDAQAALVGAVSTSGNPAIQIANVTDSVDMLTTKITIDANERSSYTAATPSVIDTTKDDVATGDILRCDVDVAGSGAKGLTVILTFQLP